MRRRNTTPDDGTDIDLADRFRYGLGGAFLGGLIAFSFTFLYGEVHWPAIAVFAAAGFVLGWFIGQQAIDFLERIWFWT